MTEWEPDLSIEAPEWLRAGAVVNHAAFGTGVVAQVGKHRGVPTMWIDFDYGERKALALEFGLRHLGPHRGLRRRTRRREDMHCDLCGSAPVVVNVDGHKLCDSHKACLQG